MTVFHDRRSGDVEKMAGTARGHGKAVRFSHFSTSREMNEFVKVFTRLMP